MRLDRPDFYRWVRSGVRVNVGVVVVSVVLYPVDECPSGGDKGENQVFGVVGYGDKKVCALGKKTFATGGDSKVSVQCAS